MTSDLQKLQPSPEAHELIFNITLDEPEFLSLVDILRDQQASGAQANQLIGAALTIPGEESVVLLEELA